MVGLYKFFPYQHVLPLAKKLYSIERLIRPAHVKERNGEQRIKMFEKFSPSAEIVFIGDSITEHGEWNEFFPSLKISNRGIGSDTTFDVLKRMDSIYSVGADKAFIMLGLNDIKKKFTVDQIVTNYSTIIELLKKRGTFVIVQSTFQCSINACSQQEVSDINLLNKRLEALAETHGVPFLKLSSLSDENGLDKKYTYDGLHLTIAGYEAWVGEIENYILTDK